MKTVRWGIVGCGDVTEIKSGPGFQKADHSSLAMVMRRNGKLAQDYARRHQVPAWTDDAEALINDPRVDAVYVATPPSSHKLYTLMAAEAGKPVYVEKPMAMNHKECLEMVQACQEAGVPLFVAYYRRRLDRFLKIKSLVDEGAVGEVRYVTINLYQPARAQEMAGGELPWRVLPEIAGGGHFIDLAAHQLDFLDYLLGPIVSAKGHAANQAGLYPAEDVVNGSFRFASGVQGSGNWCFTTFNQLDRTEIVGSRGTLSYSTFDDDPIVVENGDGRRAYQMGYPEHIQQPLIQTVVDSINGAGSCPSTGISAARTSWVMDQLLSSYSNKQE